MIKTIQQVIREMPRPYIGVIGATSPKKGYEAVQSEFAGYILRRNLQPDKGTIFTGGVEGVGVDVYNGIANFCRTQQKKLDDRFFILAPKVVQYPRRINETEEFFGNAPPVEWVDCEYQVPLGYHQAARKIGKDIVVVHEGNSFAERRRKLAEIGDVFVMINGSYGTLDEAVTALRNNKRLVILENSGGIADDVIATRRGLVKMPKMKLMHSLFDPINDEQFDESLELVMQGNIDIIRDIRELRI